MSSFTSLSLAERFALPRSFLIVGLTAVITACGGGGGGGGGSKAPSAPITVPVAAAYNKLISNGMTASTKLSGKLDGDTVGGSASFTLSPAVAATFEGQAGMSTTQTLGITVTVKGESYPLWPMVNKVYYDSNYQEIGSAFDGGEDVGTSYSVVTKSNPLPANAKAKDSGEFVTTTAYTGPSKMAAIGGTTSTWSVEADSASSLILRISTRFLDANNNLSETDDYLYRIDTAGNISFSAIEIDSPDGTKLTLKP